MLCVHTHLNGCLMQDILPQESVKVWRQRGALPRLRRVHRCSLSWWTVIREEKPLMTTFYFTFLFPSAFWFWKWRIRRRVFWRRSIDGTGWNVRSLTVPLVMAGGKPRLTLIISSYHNDISARLHTSRWFSDGQEAEEWLPCRQSIALLPLRNPVGWYHSYFIPGKDYLSDPWEMYWSVFLFPPAITWQRHLGSEWMSDVWCVCSTVEASTGHRLVLGGSAAQIMQS